MYFESRFFQNVRASKAKKKTKKNNNNCCMVSRLHKLKSNICSFNILCSFLFLFDTGKGMSEVTQNAPFILKGLITTYRLLDITLKSCKYTLKIFRFLSRVCHEDTVIKGIHIRAGMVVQMDVLAVHRDPESWGPEDPELFLPERYDYWGRGAS